jgi:hypothetical protein
MHLSPRKHGGKENEAGVMDEWQAEQFRDECERIRQCVQVLEAAQTRPLTKDEIQILADEAGVNRYTHNQT